MADMMKGKFIDSMTQEVNIKIKIIKKSKS